MSAIRNAVLARLAALGWTRYRLTRALAGKVPRSTVYGYLAGKDTKEENLALILDAVGLRVVADEWGEAVPVAKGIWIP